MAVVLQILTCLMGLGVVCVFVVVGVVEALRCARSRRAKRLTRRRDGRASRGTWGDGSERGGAAGGRIGVSDTCNGLKK
jgi:hypothetical protein